VTASLHFIHPCNPISAKDVPAGDNWLHEPKLDGYRLQVTKQSRVMRLYSRCGHDWSKRLAGLADALRAIPAHSASGCALRHRDISA
jgi:ATP-dependent DNA ligase